MENKRCLISGVRGSIGCHFLAHIMTNTDWEVVGVASFRHNGLSDKITQVLSEHPEWQQRLTMIMIFFAVGAIYCSACDCLVAFAITVHLFWQTRYAVIEWAKIVS